MGSVGLRLIVLGVVLVSYGALWQLGLAPGSRVTLPAPAALDVMPLPVVEPVSFSGQTADSVDRQMAAGLPRPGLAVRLAIPVIKLDTAVQQAGIVEDSKGNATWQTLPFVAVQYGSLTGLLGERGNAVLAGHVVTLNEGNVFRFLYQLDPGDRIQVWDDAQREHDYAVATLRLVDPSDVSVMAPSIDERLTLITCGGTFDPVKREFSDRLVVTARPIQTLH